jgi:D-alanyl-D-alanine carboxypeptidase
MTVSQPSVSALSAIVMDAESGRVLWGKNIDVPRFPASTTKVMTGLLLLEKCKPDEVITAPPGIEKVDPSSMHLRTGEKVLAHEMLYAVMLRSANDGSVAVAHHIAGSVSGFAELMNQRARELGCTHTHFENPNGLNNPRHVTSARDLAIMAREAMNHPEFREVVKQSRHKISRSMNQLDLWMVSKNRLIRKDKTIDGIKTGWTVPAGHCYVGSAFRNGFRLITVVLKSSNWQADEEELVGWGYEHFEPVFLEGEKAPKATLRSSSGGSIEVAPAGPVYALVPKGSSHDVPVRFELSQSLTSQGTGGSVPTGAGPSGPGPSRIGPSGIGPGGIGSGGSENEISGTVAAGQTVGSFVIGSGNDEFRIPAIALSGTALATGSAGGVRRGTFAWTTLILGVGLAGSALAMRRKSRLVRGFGTS